MFTKCFLIAGPTASGKSRLALRLAKLHNGVIINADSMQVYEGLAVLTACPSREELSEACHLLYNYVLPTEAYDVGKWIRDVKQQLNLYKNQPIIFVGGTGLYFKALLGGLSQIPEVSPQIREKWRYLLQEEGSEKLHLLLQKCDPTIAQRVSVTDGQRIVRALEVFDMTKKPLSYFQQQKSEMCLRDYHVEKILVTLERPVLYHNIENRFDKMMQMGALEEVKAFLNYDLPLSASAMKAIGVLEMKNYLSGEYSLEEAILRSKVRTRQYAKRQLTWFRNQFDNSWKAYNSDVIIE